MSDRNILAYSALKTLVEIDLRIATDRMSDSVKLAQSLEREHHRIMEQLQVIRETYAVFSDSGGGFDLSSLGMLARQSFAGSSLLHEIDNALSEAEDAVSRDRQRVLKEQKRSDSLLKWLRQAKMQLETARERRHSQDVEDLFVARCRYMRGALS